MVEQLKFIRLILMYYKFPRNFEEGEESYSSFNVSKSSRLMSHNHCVETTNSHRF